jgi:hypothetical protein
MHATIRLVGGALRPLQDVHVRRAIVIALLPLVLAIVGAVSSLPAAPPAPLPTNAPIILVERATAAPLPTLAPAGRAILARWDYRRPESAAALMSADIVRIVGMAGEWRLVEVKGGAQIWVQSSDLPPGTTAIEPLPDLAPRPAPTIIYIQVPAVPLPVEVEPTPAHYEMPDTRWAIDTSAAPADGRCWHTAGGGFCEEGE